MNKPKINRVWPVPRAISIFIFVTHLLSFNPLELCFAALFFRFFQHYFTKPA